MEAIEETLTGIVNRVTYHNAESGWSVLRVQPFNAPEQQETVTVPDQGLCRCDHDFLW